MSPLCYKHVADSVVTVARTAAEPGRSYCYPDDLDVVCAPAVAAQAEAVFVAAFVQVGFRGNLAKTKPSPGREVLVAALPAHPEVGLIAQSRLTEKLRRLFVHPRGSTMGRTASYVLSIPISLSKRTRP